MTREQAQANAEALFAIGIALNGLNAGTLTMRQAHLHQCVETLNRIGGELLRAEDAQWQPIRDLIERMRGKRARWQHEYGSLDVVYADKVDEWADELEAALPAPPKEMK